jgi:hypothetical protein
VILLKGLDVPHLKTNGKRREKVFKLFLNLDLDKLKICEWKFAIGVLIMATAVAGGVWKGRICRRKGGLSS